MFPSTTFCRSQELKANLWTTLESLKWCWKIALQSQQKSDHFFLTGSFILHFTQKYQPAALPLNTDGFCAIRRANRHNVCGAAGNQSPEHPPTASTCTEVSCRPTATTTENFNNKKIPRKSHWQRGSPCSALMTWKENVRTTKGTT